MASTPPPSSSIGGTPKRQRLLLSDTPPDAITPMGDMFAAYNAMRADQDSEWNALHTPLNTDLWAVILDERWLSRSDLCRCRLVCRTWSALCARAFESIEIDVSKEWPPQRVINALADTDRFVRLGRLHLYLGSRSLFVRNIGELKPLLDRLDALDVCGDLNPAARYAEPFGCSIDVRALLNALPQQLRVLTISADILKFSIEPVGPTVPPLEELYIGGETTAFQRIASPPSELFDLPKLLCLPTLRKLEILSTPGNGDPFVISRSIETLKLDGCNVRFDDQDTQRVPALKTLEIIYETIPPRGYLQAPVMPDANQRFCLDELIVHTPDPHTEFEQVMNTTFFRMLGEIQIRHVDIYLDYESDPESVAAWHALLMYKLPSTTYWVLYSNVYVLAHLSPEDFAEYKAQAEAEGAPLQVVGTISK